MICTKWKNEFSPFYIMTLDIKCTEILQVAQQEKYSEMSLSEPTRERMKLPYMTDQFEQMLKICSEFVRLQVSHDEYLCMKVLLLLSTGQTST